MKPVFFIVCSLLFLQACSTPDVSRSNSREASPPTPITTLHLDDMISESLTETSSDPEYTPLTTLPDTIPDPLASEIVQPLPETAVIPSGEAQQPDTNPPASTEIWPRLRAGYKLDPSISHQRIDQQFNWYSAHGDYLNRVNKRASRYLFHILNEIEKRGMPAELALLPIVESAFDPFAYSHGRASGIWQFIPSTGKHQGLKQDWWYDGRRDIIASTDAALNLLQGLHDRLDNDWLLALAAYNSGEGNVSRAMKKNRKKGKPTDFWSLDLPKETEAYVPKLLAVAKLYANPEAYGVSFIALEDSPYFEIVDTGSQIDLSQAASLAEIDIEELYLLNPGYNQWATHPEGPHRLLVPVQQKTVFEDALAAYPASERITWERYTIKSGDSLSTIASKHRTTVDTLQTVNKIRGSNIRAGHTLLIPTASASRQHYSLSQDQRLARIQGKDNSHSGASKQEYRVSSGDSLWSIARSHNVQVSSLAKWNGIAPKDILRPGQKLVIWVPPSALARTSPIQDKSIIRKLSYQVKRGDSLARIASKFNVKIADIADWNALDTQKYLKPGQRLTLYVDVTNAY